MKKIFEVPEFLIIAFIIVMVIISVPIAFADGNVYTGSKPVECTDPTTLENGDPITLIERVEIYIGDTAGFTQDMATQTIQMPGGCTRLPSVDIAGSGQKYQKGIAFLENGGMSALSSSLPFIMEQSPPNPPVMVE